MHHLLQYSVVTDQLQWCRQGLMRWKVKLSKVWVSEYTWVRVTTIVTNINIGKPVLVINQCHQYNWKIMLVVVKQAPCVCRLSECFVPIQGSTAIREIPPCSEPFFYNFPILCWGWHVLINTCFPNDFTDLLYNEAHNTGWQPERTSECLVLISRCQF